MNFFKKLFMRPDEKAIEEEIEKQYIFVELDLEHWYEPFYAKDLSSPADKTEKRDLQHTFFSGIAIQPNIASDTTIEFFVKTDHIDADDVVKAGIVVKHAYSTYDAIVMEAVFWNRDSTVETIPFQLNVKQDDEKSRLASALISNQKEIPFYFGRVENDSFMVEKQLVAMMPETVQNDMQITLVELYNDENRKSGPVIELETLSDREMTTAGWVMHFDNEGLKGEDLDLSLIKIEILRTVFDIISRHAGKGRFTGWIAERVADRDGTGSYGETTTFVLTASEQIHMNEKLHREIIRYMQSLKGFIREDGGYPLKYEAIPFIRQEGNQYGFVSFDEDFLRKADMFSRKMTNKDVNLYNKLLKMNAAT